MSSLIVEVCTIDEIIKHDNADKLEIARIKGWFCIVGKDNHKVGDVITFVPPDSVLPDNIIDEYKLTYLKKGSRVRATKLRGVVSQGIVLPNITKKAVGTNVASDLGITKWEPPVKGTGLGYKQQLKKRHINQNFSKYTDIENIRNFNTVFEKDEIVVIHEKVHGSNWRCGNLKRTPRQHWFWGIIDTINLKLFGEYEFVYGSHNVQLRLNNYVGVKEGFYESNVYKRALEKYSIKDTCPKDTIVYGEVYGDGIQDLTYGLKKDIDLIVFDVKFNGVYLSNEELIIFCKEHGLKLVPELYKGPWDESLLKHYTSGDSIVAQMNGVKQIREGVVIRPIKESVNHRLGRKILKSISEDYLTRKSVETEEATEYK